MDDFGSFDYKKPITEQDQDMRTSYYRGYRNLNDTHLADTIKEDYINKNCYVRDPLLYEKKCSEYEDKYVFQYTDPNELRNPTASMKTQHMKTFDAHKMHFISRPMKPMKSVTQETYTWQQPQFDVPPAREHLPTPVMVTKEIIDRAKPTYIKYLDPTATTMRLSYVKHTPQELESGIGAKDYVTFWNWDQNCPNANRISSVKDDNKKTNECYNLITEACTKERSEYENPIKFLPHTGLTTEMRENYINPKERSDYIEYDTSDIAPLHVSTAIEPFSQNSEYGIYGSGEPVLKYV